MGSAQSLVTPEAAITATAALVVAGTVGYGMTQQQNEEKDPCPSSGMGPSTKGKKKKKKQNNEADPDSFKSASEGGVTTVTTSTTATTASATETATVVPFPKVIPGDFDVTSMATTTSSKGKSKDRFKGKAKQTVGDDLASSATPSESPLPPAMATSGSKSKKAKKKKKPASSSNLASGSVASSSKVSSSDVQASSAVLEKENHLLQSPSVGTGAGEQAKESLKSSDSSSAEDGEDEKLPPMATNPVPAAALSVPRPLQDHLTSHDTDSSWTHVHRKSSHPSQPYTSGISTAEVTTSDAGVASSMTDDGYPSSSVAERPGDTEDEEAQGKSLGFGSDYVRGAASTQKRPLAERILPKPRITGVEDMLEVPDYPSLSRELRVRPMPGEKPASGFSWADYEDVHVDEGAGHDADGEDDGWGVVRSRRSKSDRGSSSALANTEAPNPQAGVASSGPSSKKQRQNAKKRDAAKAAKADGEVQRLAALAKHQQQLEKSRMMDQVSQTVGKAPSGGMKAAVDDNGKLVWE